MESVKALVFAVLVCAVYSIEQDNSTEYEINVLKNMFESLPLQLSEETNEIRKDMLEETSETREEMRREINEIKQKFRALTPNVGSVITVRGAAVRGTWFGFEMCPAGSFAIGFDVKIEGAQGRGDDTSLNAIQLLCEDVTTKYITTVSSAQGPWGSWKGLKKCPNDYYLVSFRLKNEADTGDGDETAINGINMKCRGRGVRGTRVNTITTQEENPWGRWTGWSSSCPSGQAICGIATRIQENQKSRDDTALNDAKFQCCYN